MDRQAGAVSFHGVPGFSGIGRCVLYAVIPYVGGQTEKKQLRIWSFRISFSGKGVDSRIAHIVSGLYDGGQIGFFSKNWRNAGG